MTTARRPFPPHSFPGCRGARDQTYRPQPGIGQYSVSKAHRIENPAQQPNRFDRAQMADDITT
jgi:hypothetical protein